MIAVALGGKPAFTARARTAVRGHEITKDRVRPDELAVRGARNVFLPYAIDEQAHRHLRFCPNVVIPQHGDRVPAERGWTCGGADARRRPMNDISLTVVAETADDTAAIERLHERTFGPGRYAKTAYRLREQVDHSLDVSFTARIGTLLVGSVRLSPIRIGEV